MLFGDKESCLINCLKYQKVGFFSNNIKYLELWLNYYLLKIDNYKNI